MLLTTLSRNKKWKKKKKNQDGSLKVPLFDLKQLDA